jgi:hypothetical protein
MTRDMKNKEKRCENETNTECYLDDGVSGSFVRKGSDSCLMQRGGDETRHVREKRERRKRETKEREREKRRIRGVGETKIPIPRRNREL